MFPTASAPTQRGAADHKGTIDCEAAGNILLAKCCGSVCVL